MRRFLILASLLACSTPKPAPVSPATPPPIAASVVRADDHARVLRGRVLDHAGKALAAGHVLAIGADGSTLSEHAIARDGAFEIPLAGVRERGIRVRFSGVDSRPETIFVAAGDAPVDVTVRLGSYELTPPKKDYPFIVFKDSQPLERRTLGDIFKLEAQPDGTFLRTVDLDDGAYSYQLMGLSTEGNPMNGQAGEGYRLDRDGHYASTFTVSGGKATIVFDPKRLPASDRPSAVTFGERSRVSAGTTDVLRRVTSAENDYRAKAFAAMRAGKQPNTVLTGDYWAPARAELTAIAREHPERAVREAAAVASFALGSFGAPTEPEKALARTVMQSVPPDDPLWTLWPVSARNVMLAAGGGSDTEEFAARYVERQLDPCAVASFLYSRLETEKDAARARSLFATIKLPRFEKCSEVQRAKVYDPDSPTAVGRDIAAFVFPALTGDKVDPKNKHTAASLAGKVYLIDVWATWCKPCLVELGRLAEIHATYAKRGKTQSKGGFEILSVSLDDKSATVAAFRREKGHEMPWLHAVPGQDGAALEKLTGMERPPVPFHILVDAKGKIVAATPRLNVDELPRYLDTLLPP